MEKTLHSEGHRRLVALLRECRETAGLTQVEVARRLRRGQGFVSTYESGQRRLDLVELDAICTALGVDVISFVRRWQKRAPPSG